MEGKTEVEVVGEEGDSKVVKTMTNRTDGMCIYRPKSYEKGIRKERFQLRQTNAPQTAENYDEVPQTVFLHMTDRSRKL